MFGKQAFQLDHGRFTYLFSSAETKAEFDKAPEKYAIQMGGLCARMGRTVTGNPSDYLVHDGKIYIFGSDACHKSFASAPEKYLPKPAAPMPRIRRPPRGPGAPRQGCRAARREARHDGELRRDASRDAEAADGRHPDHDPQGVALPRRRTQGTMARALTEEKCIIRDTADRERRVEIGGPQLAPGRSRRHSVRAARSRPAGPVRCCAPGARRERTVAALGAGNDGGRRRRARPRQARRPRRDAEPRRRYRSGPFDNVHRQRARRTVRRVHACVYSDFRAVDGVTVPFEEKAIFNGTVDPTLSRKLESVSINGPLDEALFKVSQ